MTNARLLKYLLVCALAGGVAYFIARPYLVHASDISWDHTAAIYPAAGAPQAIVHGWSNAPLEQCRYQLLWKTGDDQWAVYQLTALGRTWDNYQLKMDDGVLEVLLGNQKVALLDPHTGAFTNLRTQQTDKAPAAVIHGANLDHEDHWVYYSGAK